MALEQKSFSQVFAERLRLLREMQGWSQQNMADALNVCRSTYTRYENASSSPSLELTQQIARLLGADIRFLFQLPIEDTAVVAASNERDRSPLAVLPDEERRLLLLFRSLSDERKEELFNAATRQTLADFPSESEIRPN